MFIASRRNALLLTATTMLKANSLAQEPTADSDFHEEIAYFPMVDGDVTYKLEMTVFRPKADGVYPLVVINHGVSADKSRAAIGHRARPLAQARMFVAKGYVVAVPMRRGYGMSEGTFAPYSCNIYGTANEEAKDIVAAVHYLNSLPYVSDAATTLLGVSAGALASLAAANKLRGQVTSVLNFSGGRRLRAGQASECYPRTLLDAISLLGKEVSVPTLWLYSPSDPVFDRQLVRELLAAFRDSGGKAEYTEIPVYRGDAHDIFSNVFVMPLWWARVQVFLGDRSMRMQKTSSPATSSQARP